MVEGLSLATATALGVPCPSPCCHPQPVEQPRPWSSGARVFEGAASEASLVEVVQIRGAPKGRATLRVCL